MKGNFSGPLNQVRSKEGVERLVNLICLSYSAPSMFLYSGKVFSEYMCASAQKIRYEMGQRIQMEILLCSFGRFFEMNKNCSALRKVVEDYIISDFRKFQML